MYRRWVRAILVAAFFGCMVWVMFIATDTKKLEDVRDIEVTELTKESVAAAPDALRIGERKHLTISFYFPPESGNDLQQAVMTFDVGAEAVQTKNTPNRLFN